MKQRRRIDQSVQDEAIKIFKGLRGKISNQAIAQRLHLSLRRVSQLKKQFEQTGTIKITYKNQHSDEFQRRRQEEREGIRKIRQEFPHATLNQISQKMLEKGYFVSNSTISLRLEKKQAQEKLQSQEEDSEILKAFRQFREKHKTTHSNLPTQPAFQASVPVGDYGTLVEEENPRISVLPKEECKLAKERRQAATGKAEPKDPNILIPPNNKNNPHFQGNFPRRPIHPHRFSQLQSCQLLKKALRYRRIAQQASYLSRKAEEQLQLRIQYLPSPLQLEYSPKKLEDVHDPFLNDQFLNDQLLHLI